jgi:acyl-coenzyme A thioesterase PaaI-like protein
MALDVTPTFAAWKKLPSGLVGSTAFSLAMCLRVPYFRTLLPRVVELEPGRCVVTAPKWWGVKNHLGTFHAIAACNLAEVAMGMLAEATVPPTHRWIPKSMATRYLAPAKTSLRAIAELPERPIFGDEGQELIVPVAIRDRDGTEVVHADITIWVTKRPLQRRSS